MKRLRDDVYVNLNPQFKRPFASSRGESNRSSPSPVGGGGVAAAGGSGTGAGVAAASTQKLTTYDALTYLKEVKDIFQDQREKYDRFLDVMKDFKAQRIDTAGVIARVKELFKGHPNLILGFNTFLPKGYEITLTDEEETPPRRTVEFEEAISFVNKIKKRFQNDDRVYKSFLDILNMYRKEHKGITEVYQEVAELFDDQPDLLDEFARFLPNSSATSSAPHASFGRQSFRGYDERSSPMPAMQHLHMDKHPQRDRITDPYELSVERPDVDDDKTVLKFHREQKHAEKENREKRSHNQDDRDPDNEINGDINMHRLSDKRQFYQKVEDLGGNSNLASSDDKDAFKSMYSHEFTFCEKVKERLRNADDYQAFLKCLHIYSTEIVTRKELQSLVADLLGNYPDLMEGFNEFLERCERIDGFLAGVMGKKTLWSEGISSKTLRTEDKDKEHKREVEGGKDKDRYNLKYWGKSIQELDLSNCQSCTPSYRLLPNDYPIPSASQRSELGAQVLNDHLVSVTSGSEDYSFKHMRRNHYEEILFRCEDDRFELDMLLESVSSTAKQAEEFLNSINNDSIDSDSPIRIEDHFTALNLRCIERLYGDHSIDVTDIFRKNPTLALPVILTRLKQKQEEWTKCRSDFNKIWGEIYSKNHYKSLDHRSFYFKQQDSKNLSTKSLVAEIKEIKEKRQKEDDLLLSIAAGRRHSIIPNLEFENVDTEIHEDVYKIIKYSSEEVCSTKEQLNKVLRFWTTFLEPILGVHSRIHVAEATENDVASNHQTVKNTTKDIIESEGSPSTDDTTMNLKQPKLNRNGDPNTSTQQMNFSRTGFTNVDVLAKDGLTVASGERLMNFDEDVNVEADPNHGHGANYLQSNNNLIDEGHRAKSTRKDILSSEAPGILRLNQSMNMEFQEDSRLVECIESVDPCKNEKEEGELSPNGDFEDNFGGYQDGSLHAMPERNCGNDGMQCQMGFDKEISRNAVGENDADDDDEDSENASDAREDVSGNESAVDECSPEEHEEEEDGEHEDLDGKVLSEGEAENTSEADNVSVSMSQHFLLTCKPLSKHVAAHLVGDERKDRRIFYGNDTFYVLFRLHQTLYERIFTAKLNSVSCESKWRTTKDANFDPYARFMSSLFSLIDGSSDNTKFEDDCRALIGNQSYVLFTLDKLIYKLVKLLQTVSNEEVNCKLLQLYEYEKSRKPEKYVDSVYYENVHVLLHDENIYRLECISSPTRLSIQLMDDGNEKSEVVSVPVDPNFATYLHNDYLSVVHGKKESSAIMLKRNMCKYANLEEFTPLYIMATEKVHIVNGLECKMAAISSKISYVLDTEDSFIRFGRKRENKSADRSLCSHQKRVQRFHQFLESSLSGVALF